MDLSFFTIDNSNRLKGIKTVKHPPCESPAKVYNEYLLKCKTKYVCFLHSDISQIGLKDAILRTIDLAPDFGALGMVGSNWGTRWSRQGQIWELVTCDSCLIVINREHGLSFDEKTFPNYHLYVEDYCMQVRSLGLKVFTLDINAYEYSTTLTPREPYAIHHSQTLHLLGCSWGDYPVYRKKLSEKWKDVQTT